MSCRMKATINFTEYFWGKNQLDLQTSLQLSPRDIYTLYTFSLQLFILRKIAGRNYIFKCT